MYALPVCLSEHEAEGATVEQAANLIADDFDLSIYVVSLTHDDLTQAQGRYSMLSA